MLFYIIRKKGTLFVHENAVELLAAKLDKLHGLIFIDKIMIDHELNVGVFDHTRRYKVRQIDSFRFRKDIFKSNVDVVHGAAFLGSVLFYACMYVIFNYKKFAKK